jgi:hypothetical protein
MLNQSRKLLYKFYDQFDNIDNFDFDDSSIDLCSFDDDIDSYEIHTWSFWFLL